MRHEEAFPNNVVDLGNIFIKMWTDGWLDDFSDDHFLIRALENRIDNLEWKTQLISNNAVSIYTPINSDGSVDYSSFSCNFICNLSATFQGLIKIFGEENIKRFVIDQLSAGKNNYNKDAFFQALSEIEILRFFISKKPINAEYEPPVSGKKSANPEASFEYNVHIGQETQHVKINVEVKTPKFPIVQEREKSFVIPTILLNNQGRQEFIKICQDNEIDFLMPRVTKLVQFINSAAKKFSIPQQNEFNLLYINWSYSDYPICSFIEAWNLLTNEKNGLLLHPEIATSLPFEEPLDPKAYDKITAIVVYSNSLEQLMFGDFRYSWQTVSDFGPRFRMYVLNSQLREDEIAKKSRLLFNVTGMNPDLSEKGKFKMLADPAKNASEDEKIELRYVLTKLYQIIEKDYLS